MIGRSIVLRAEVKAVIAVRKIATAKIKIASKCSIQQSRWIQRQIRWSNLQSLPNETVIEVCERASILSPGGLCRRRRRTPFPWVTPAGFIRLRNSGCVSSAVLYSGTKTRRVSYPSEFITLDFNRLQPLKDDRLADDCCNPSSNEGCRRDFVRRLIDESNRCTSVRNLSTASKRSGLRPFVRGSTQWNSFMSTIRPCDDDRRPVATKNYFVPVRGTLARRPVFRGAQQYADAGSRRDNQDQRGLKIKEGINASPRRVIQ